MPVAHVDRPQLLQLQLAEVRVDLVFGELAIAFQRFGPEFVPRIVEPLLDVLFDRHLARIDERAGVDLCQQLGELFLGILAPTLDGDVAGSALAVRAWSVELDLPRILAAVGDIASGSAHTTSRPFPTFPPHYDVFIFRRVIRAGPGTICPLGSRSS